MANDDRYVKFSDDTNESIDKKVGQRIIEAYKASLSNKRVSKLATIIDQHRAIFQIRLGSGGPGRAFSLKITSDSTKGL